MTRLVILGDSIASISAAHRTLDMKPDMEIQIITERAEIGLTEEVPGLIGSWPPCSPNWISDMGSQTPLPSSTAVRGSWLLKAMGIQLSKRGCKFHMRTRVTSVSEGRVDFVGAGPLGSDSLTFDHLLDFSGGITDTETQWKGAVCRTEDTPNAAFHGSRPDGTTEAWDTQGLQQNGKWLQTMTWTGRNPELFIADQVRIGKERADSVIETIIQSTTSQ